MPTESTKAPHIKKALHDLDLRTVLERALVCCHINWSSLSNAPRIGEASGANVHRRLLTGGCANRRIAVKEHQRFAPVVLKTTKIDRIGNTK